MNELMKQPFSEVLRAWLTHGILDGVTGRFFTLFLPLPLSRDRNLRSNLDQTFSSKLIDQLQILRILNFQIN